MAKQPKKTTKKIVTEEIAVFDESKLAILDGDFLAYWFGQHTFKVDDTSYSVESAKKAVLRMELYLYNLFNRVGATHYLGILQMGQSFRECVFKLGYKANRKDRDKPLFYKQIREALFNEYAFKFSSDLYVFRSYETDDFCASYRTLFPTATLVSNDKDVLNLPGKNYNVNEEEFVTSTQDAYERFVWSQMIIGDSADNLKGLKGKGAMYSTKLFKGIPTEDLPALVLDEYIKEHGRRQGIEAYYEMCETVFLRQDIVPLTDRQDIIDSRVIKIDYKRYDILLEQSKSTEEKPLQKEPLERILIDNDDRIRNRRLQEMEYRILAAREEHLVNIGINVPAPVNNPEVQNELEGGLDLDLDGYIDRLDDAEFNEFEI